MNYRLKFHEHLHFFVEGLEVVRLAGTCREGWLTMPNWEAEEVNTLGCCFYWTLHPGAVVTATSSPKIYDGTACDSYCKNQVAGNQLGHTLLFAFFNIYFSFLLRFVSFVLPSSLPRYELSGCCRLKQIATCCTKNHGVSCPWQRLAETNPTILQTHS